MCVFMVFEAGERERQDSSEKNFRRDKVGRPSILSDAKCLHIINSLIHVVYIENENFGVRGLGNQSDQLIKTCLSIERKFI